MKFHIGKRVIKTCLAVCLTLLIYFVLMVLDHALKLDNQTFAYAPTNWYTPFFAAIATVYAMQNNPQGSIRQAKIRSWGSVIGGYFGAIVIYIFEHIYLMATGHSSITEVTGNLDYRIWLYVVTAIGIIFLIPFTVGLKKSLATWIACLTYLSVTVSIRNGGMEVIFFATNRVISTIIGVLISLMINTFPHFVKRNKNILFISSLDNAILNHDAKLTPYCNYKLNDLYNKNCSLTFMTTRALTSLGEIFKDVNLQEPIIVMNGCAIYNPQNREYKSLRLISSDERKILEPVLKKYDVTFFTYLINRGILNCYFNKLDGWGATHYYDLRKNGLYYSFAEAITPENLDVSQYVLVEKNDVINSIIEDIKKVDKENCFNIVTYPYAHIEGYSFLKINHVGSNKENALKELMQKKKNDYVICIGSGHTDIEAMRQADFAVCLQGAPDYIKEEADYIIPSDKPDDLMRFVDKVFIKNDYKKYLNSLTNKNN